MASHFRADNTHSIYYTPVGEYGCVRVAYTHATAEGSSPTGFCNITTGKFPDYEEIVGLSMRFGLTLLLL
jgi:hypothetical protein